nr:hypothetical protein [Tanacetum cinerariifolium]
MYKGKHKELEMGYTSRISVAPKRNRILPCATYNFVHHNRHNEVDIDNMTLEEYARYELAIIGAKNIRKMEYEVPNWCDDETMDITDYEDSDQEDGEIPNFLALSVTNVFAGVYEQKPSRDFTRPLGKPSGLKGLLHTLNAAVIPTNPLQVDAHRVVLGLYLATRKYFKSGLVGYHVDDDDGLELWMLLMEADLKHGLEHGQCINQVGGWE